MYTDNEIARWIIAALSGALLGVFLAQPATAHDEDTLEVGLWDLEATAKMSASQAAYRAWQDAGVSTLAFTSGLYGQARQQSDSWVHKHELRVSFGLIRQESFEEHRFRKSEDVIRLNTALRYVGNGFFSLFNPTFAVSVRTQFAPGYNYDKVPVALEQAGYKDDLPVQVSALLSPGTFGQSLGLTYEPVPWFRQRFGVAGKQTLVTIERLRPIYNPEGRRVRVELGMDSHTEFGKEVFENVRVKSSLGFFAAVNNPDVPDLLWENRVTMRVNSWLSADFEYVALYDRDVTDAIQMKEVLALGVSLALI